MDDLVMAASDHPRHTVLGRKLQAYLRWRNANARHPDVLTAQRRERACIRSERHQRWGPPNPITIRLPVFPEVILFGAFNGMLIDREASAVSRCDRPGHVQS